MQMTVSCDGFSASLAPHLLKAYVIQCNLRQESNEVMEAESIQYFEKMKGWSVCHVCK